MSGAAFKGKEGKVRLWNAFGIVAGNVIWLCVLGPAERPVVLDDRDVHQSASAATMTRLRPSRLAS
jgi:hypothetical protein